ncbi:bifunctional precorrin-2 dehydrogenase/sirohydrochlorin ferrochelatase [Fulvivirgaceae bacterium PWU4]|uniref:precorrin-2 dehydrogenase n=1 Tax=Chryseosolibacter histidini TaxID=2782349 RepID=A0AAP2DTI4_9BACT|nr:bifunctional precorrin-2 dehydrogenase/sirohydrochlorin ferrochelatase [Chryseosolibacter histidini]MBT1701239.1 bifunctional precorrin-2 dehydrogenase/sirohydrochlorin ferrochelatase [Chryseosolibacter histidini]
MAAVENSEERNNLFPIFLKLEELHTLIVGGGNVGLEKISGLLKSSPAARITVVAEKISDEIRNLASQSKYIFLNERSFRIRDLQNKDLVILATDDKALHERIRIQARKKRILVNVADTPDLCDFYLGSVVTKGNLKIGISTNGKSPTIAKRMREYFEEVLPDNTNQLLDNMQKIRDRIKGDFRRKVDVLNEITASWLGKSSSD